MNSKFLPRTCTHQEVKKEFRIIQLATHSFFSKSGPASQQSMAEGAMLRSPTTNILRPWPRRDSHLF